MADIDECERIVTAKERRHLIPFSDMHINRLEQSGDFPRRVRIGANRVGWLLSELQAWIEEKAEARDDSQHSPDQSAARSATQKTPVT